MDKEFDVLLWGATGFTGRLTAQHLADRYGVDGEGLRWTIGGRNLEKLEAVRTALKAADGQLTPVVADANDLDAMREAASRARVVCSAVGPYARYGSSLVQACAENGADYCDLTGEVQWMRAMMDAHGEAAEASGARIVHTCGFDCIPSDLGVLYVQRAMQERHGIYAKEVKLRVLDFKGGFSGGTIASMIELMEQASLDSNIRDLLTDPYSLNPTDADRGLDGPDRLTAFYDEDFAAWAAPFIMGPVNTRVVRRSHALMGHPYGPEFRYDEAIAFPKLPTPGAWAAANAMAAASAGTMAAMTLRPVRELAARHLPQPGSGPSEQQMADGYFKLALLARHPEDKAKNVLAYVQGDRDPGYGATAKMLAESAVCLAQDGSNAPGGFSTPATAMGTALIDRLNNNAGVRFSLG